MPSLAVLELGDRSAPPSAVLAPHLGSGLHGMLALSSRAQPQLLAPHLSSGLHGMPALSSRAQAKSLPHRRFSSDQKKLPPVSQLAFKDDHLVSQEEEWEWVELTEYLKNRSLVEDATKNHLNMEVEGFGVRGKYNFSEDTGIPLFENLVLLALANNNRGYCIKRSFTKENLLVCPRLKQIKLKSVIYDELKPGVNDCNRAATYEAVGLLIRELLKDNVGPDVIQRLLEEPRDLLSKLERPSDERLIIYHPSFLSMDGRLWYYEKLYRLVFKIFPENARFKKRSNLAVAGMAYTDGNVLIFDIISSHPLLYHIERRASDEAERPDESEGPEGKVDNHKKRDLGRKVVALHRHTVEHAFDHDVRNTPSKQASRKRLWPYTIRHVVNFLKSVMPLHLLKSQESFVRFGLWDTLNIDGFWSRDLSWIGGVPAPSEEEMKAIDQVSYGRRRLQARKYD